MTENHLLAEVRDKVLYITFNRPEKHNALSQQLLIDLKGIFESHSMDESIVAAVLTGSGRKTFAAGGDLRELSKIRTESAAREMSNNSKLALNSIRTFPLPVIAALNGNTFGGAAELAVACDFRIADFHAKIGFVQGRLALSTAWGGGADLFQLVGRSNGLKLLLTGKMLSSSEALEIGLVDQVVSVEGELKQSVEDFLIPLRNQHAHVIRTFKELADAKRRGDSKNDLNELETELFVSNWINDAHWEAAEKVLPTRK
ncbi:MAG: enoyl-CoA hydratase/isomerase family protein [Alphaproteobacteria bacterium]|nr:enoyl-CoA hydratase/isomerase family protein [Alphaproteobacteria bacterium]|tara:strand:+ start:1045 stop:1818 length:774 start_codon:yes stop_codon:yes gene_type:complete